MSCAHTPYHPIFGVHPKYRSNTTDSLYKVPMRWGVHTPYSVHIPNTGQIPPIPYIKCPQLEGAHTPIWHPLTPGVHPKYRSNTTDSLHKVPMRWVCTHTYFDIPWHPVCIPNNIDSLYKVPMRWVCTHPIFGNTPPNDSNTPFWDPFWDPFLDPFLTPFWDHPLENSIKSEVFWPEGVPKWPLFGPLFDPKWPKMTLFDPLFRGKLKVNWHPVIWPLLAKWVIWGL